MQWINLHSSSSWLSFTFITSRPSAIHSHGGAGKLVYTPEANLSVCFLLSLVPLYSSIPLKMFQRLYQYVSLLLLLLSLILMEKLFSHNFPSKYIPASLLYSFYLTIFCKSFFFAKGVYEQAFIVIVNYKTEATLQCVYYLGHVLISSSMVSSDNAESGNSTHVTVNRYVLLQKEVCEISLQQFLPT